MEVPGKLEIQNTAATKTRIELDGDAARLVAGGAGASGGIVLEDASDHERIRLGIVNEVAVPSSSGGGAGGGTSPVTVADYWGLRVRTAAGKDLVRLGRIPDGTAFADDADEPPVELLLGGAGHPGEIVLNDASGEERVRLGRGSSGDNAVLELRGPSGTKIARLSAQGSLRLESDGKPQVRIENADLWLGGNQKHGEILLFDTTGDNQTRSQARIHLNGASGAVTLRRKGDPSISLDAMNADVRAGGSGRNGDVLLFPAGAADQDDASRATVHATAKNGRLSLRHADPETGKVPERILLDAKSADLWLGGQGANGDLMLFAAGEQDHRKSSKATIRLDGKKGDIVLRNADCAEEFEVGEPGPIEPGTVMVIDSDGRMRASRASYDRRVAGVVSGAHGLAPGIVLGRRPGAGGRLPIALAGKVYCRVDASRAPIRTGDLLTTSRIAGCAMKARDRRRAFGAVIGKALAGLASGRGAIPILVALQ